MKLSFEDSGSDCLGVVIPILFLIRNIASIFVLESTQDVKVTGHITSSSNSSVDNPSLSTKRLEMQLMGAAESNKHLANCVPFAPLILTTAVGRRGVAFCLRSADKEVILDVDVDLGIEPVVAEESLGVVISRGVTVLLVFFVEDDFAFCNLGC